MSLHELDLIPADYRERAQIQRKCIAFGVVLAALILVMAGLRYALAYKSGFLQSEIHELQNHKNSNLQQQNKANELFARERLLTKRLEILDGLQGGLSTKYIFMAIDRVQNGDVWFTQWAFRRALEAVELTPQSAESGYITIPESESETHKSQSWRLQTHMEISGQALDHAGLSLFVSKLIKQPEIADVKVLNTNMRSYTSVEIVDFKMIVIVNNKFQADHD